MLPVRPCSSLAAASSAGMAGGELSEPTTGYRSPAGGAVAFIAAKAIRFPGASSRYPACGRHHGLAHPSWRTHQPFGRRLGSRGLLARGAALVMQAATYMAKLKLVMNTLASFTLPWKPGSSPPSAAATEAPAAATAPDPRTTTPQAAHARIDALQRHMSSVRLLPQARLHDSAGRPGALALETHVSA